MGPIQEVEQLLTWIDNGASIIDCVRIGARVAKRLGQIVEAPDPAQAAVVEGIEAAADAAAAAKYGRTRP